MLADLPDDSRFMTEEPFGPMAGMVRFKTVEEVLSRANSLRPRRRRFNGFVFFARLALESSSPQSIHIPFSVLRVSSLITN